MGSFLLPDNSVSWFLFNHLFRLTTSFLSIGCTFLTECYLLVHSLIIEAHYWFGLFHYYLILRHLLAASALTLAVYALAVAAIAGFDLNWLTALAVRAMTICAAITTLFGCLNHCFCLWLISTYALSLFSCALAIHTVTNLAPIYLWPVNLYLIGLYLLICILSALTINTVTFNTAA